MSTGSVEVVYRGIFQKTLAKNICRGVVFAAKNEGKIGIAFGNTNSYWGWKRCWRYSRAWSRSARRISNLPQ